MTKKELLNIAQNIAKAEIKISQTSDEKEIKNLESFIVKVSEKISSIDDLITIDNLVQDILSNFNKKNKEKKTL